jgi:predicted ATPase
MVEDVGRVAIRTPDQRLRVFVSSTLTELADERAAVARAISSLRLTPVLFELGAREHPPRELYRAYLAQCEIFVGIYWQRYGWIGPGMEISGLEDELRLAHAMPRLLYVKTPAPDREAALTAMIDELQAQGTVSYRGFHTPRELGRLVQDDLALLLSERFAATDSGPDRHASPAASGGRRFSRSLPVTTTTLIGREQDTAEVARQLARVEVRLVTLTGPGGIGKTRLAVAVGERVGDNYAQGVVFVGLASVTQPDLVLPRIAAAAGLVIEGTRSPLETLVEEFSQAAILLILDNFEQVIGAAPDVDELLLRCPRLDILATSGTVLRLRAEHEYAVGPLAVPGSSREAPADQLVALPAVQLFVDRARAVRHDFTLNDDNAVAVGEIVRRLDGMPLAIELAAARVRLLDPTALLSRLERGLDALGTGSVDLPERQRTLRSTVEWSVGLLESAERQMLATLAIFVDGWTVEAAVAVSGLTDDRTLELLDALAAHSLVSVDAAAGGLRLRMLLPIREFAAERLAADPDRPDVERRHAAYFRTLIENVDGPAERQADWAARLRTEEGNLGVAIRWFFDHDIAPLPHMLLVLCQNNWLFWEMRDRMHEGRAWIQELLLRADALSDRARAEVLLIATATAVEVGDDDSAVAARQGMQAVEGTAADPYLQSATQLAVAWTLPIAEDFAGALKAAVAARDGFSRENEPLQAWAALTVGLLEMALGRYDAADGPLTEAVQLGHELGNEWLELGARTQLASLAVAGGRLDDARAQLVQTLEATEDTELSTQTVTFCLVAYARLELADRDPRAAATALGAVQGLRRRAGLRAWPSMRRAEAELATRVRQAAGADVFEQAVAAGAALNQPEAVALVRGRPRGAVGGGRPVA